MSSNVAVPRAATNLLPKPRRLTDKRDFDEIFKCGRVVDSQLTRLIWRQGEGKVAVTTVKSLGSLARRNQVKRKWREALRLVLNETSEDVDFVLLVKASGAETKMPERQAELKAAFGKIER